MNKKIAVACPTFAEAMAVDAIKKSKGLIPLGESSIQNVRLTYGADFAVNAEAPYCSSVRWYKSDGYEVISFADYIASLKSVIIEEPDTKYFLTDLVDFVCPRGTIGIDITDKSTGVACTMTWEELEICLEWMPEPKDLID